MNRPVSDLIGLEQEVVAHLFLDLSAPPGEWQASAHDVWDRFRRLQHADRPTSAAWPTRLPSVLPQAPLHGSVPVACVQDEEGLDQAIARRDHGTLVLSLLLGAGQGRTWSGLEARLEDVLGACGAAHLGTAVVLLGKTAGDSPDGLDLSEQGPLDDTRPLRRLLLLGRTGQDALLSSWAWSEDGAMEIPPFVRYLMHMAAIRYQLRVHLRLDGDPARGASGPRFVIRRATYGGAVGELVLDGPGDTLRALRHTVDGSWENAGQALGHAGRTRGGRLSTSGVLDDDRAFVAWFARSLEDDVESTEIGRGRPYASTSAPDTTSQQHRTPQAASADAHDPVRILSVADEWFPAHGGVSTFNRQLCIALAAAGAEVRVLVHASSAQEQRDAKESDVHLLDTAQPGLSIGEALMCRPDLPPGFRPDLVIGHGRVTGPAARVQARDHFPGSRRLHFLHVEPDQAEWHRPERTDDAGARAQARTELEFELGRQALRVMPVGPRLEARLLRERRLPGYEDLPQSVRIDPGFDGGPAAALTPPDGIPQILVMGRLEDAHIKGLDIACRALGRAVPAGSRPGDWELLVRGAPPEQSADLRTRADRWIRNPAVDVTVRPFSPEPFRIRQDVARASLVLMPSRAEAFGLVGLEAVVAGVPVLVSSRSGLGKLLCESLPSEVWRQVVVDVDGGEDRAKADASRWGTAIGAVMFDRPGAFLRAARLQEAMAGRVTWSAAAARVLQCARAADRT